MAKKATALRTVDDFLKAINKILSPPEKQQLLDKLTGQVNEDEEWSAESMLRVGMRQQLKEQKQLLSRHESGPKAKRKHRERRDAFIKQCFKDRVSDPKTILKRLRGERPRLAQSYGGKKQVDLKTIRNAVARLKGELSHRPEL